MFDPRRYDDGSIDTFLGACAEMLLELAPEIAETWDGPDIEDADPLWKATVDDYELIDTEDGPALLVFAIGEGSESVKTTRARYNPPSKAHPAEYERYDATVHWSVVWWPSGEGLDGECEVVAHVEGGAPSPGPSYEPHGL